MRDPRPDLDWTEIRRVLRGHLARRAHSGDREHLDDLVQEACVRLFRAIRRGPVDNLDGLASTIAKRTWVDFIRRRTRWRRVFSEGTEWESVPAFAKVEFGDPKDRLQFIVMELLERNGSDACRDLARAYFSEMDWKTVAETVNRSYAAVRKQWSRCVEEVRRHVHEDPHLGRLFDPRER